MVSTTSERSGAAEEPGTSAARESIFSERDFNAAILNAAANLLVVVDANGTVLRFNRACEELSGYPHEMVEGRTFWEVLGWGDPVVAERLKARFEGRGTTPLPPSWEETWVVRDGSSRLISWSLSMLTTPSARPQYFIASGVDITHRREQEEELRESEERFRSLFQHSIDAVLLSSPDGTVYAANPEACRIFGCSEEEICRQGRGGLVDPSSPTLSALLEERQRTGRARGELILRRADGTTFPGEVSSSIFLDRHGQQRTSMVIRDATERKLAEEALKESEERFRRAFDDAATGMALVGMDGQWLKVNRALCEILGYTEEELLATDFQSLTHPDDLEQDLAYVRQMLDMEIQTYQMEKRYIHRQGHIVWALLSASIVHDSVGRALYFLSQVQDISARKRAEEAQRLLVDAGTVLVSSIDYTQTLQNVARLVVRSLADYCIIYLLEEDGLIHRTAGAHAGLEQARLVEEVLRYSPSAGVNNVVRKVISTGEPVLMVEIPQAVMEETAYDEAQLHAMQALNIRSGIVVPLEAPDRVIGAMGLLLSGSERRYSGADLSLARDVARRAALALDNARLFRQAGDAVAGRDALLSVVSHDMTNYLMAISAFTNLLPNLVPRNRSPESEQLIEGLAHIRGAAQQMDRLVRDLLDFAKVQAGRPINLERRLVDLVALTREVVAQQHTSAKHKIVVNAEEPEITGSWDGDQLSRVLVNLLSNAVKYSPRGGEVLVSLSREEDEAGKWAVVSVRDQGVGIPKQDLPNLFTRFGRAGNVLDIKGAGLGLFSVHELVKLHGGTVSVESEEEVGSVFTVRLPLHGR